MMWLFAVLLVLAMGAVAMVAAGRGTPLQEEYDDRPDAFVGADRALGAGDLRAVRFSLAVRGYRMSEVDTLLARLAAQLEAAAGEEPAAIAPPAIGHPEIEPSEIEPSEIEPSEIEPSEIEPVEIQASEIEPVEIQRPAAEEDRRA